MVKWSPKGWTCKTLFSMPFLVPEDPGCANPISVHVQPCPVLPEASLSEDVRLHPELLHTLVCLTSLQGTRIPGSVNGAHPEQPYMPTQAQSHL